MVLIDDDGNRPVKIYLLQYLIGDLGVSFHKTIFDVSEPTGLPENFRRDGYLSHIMDQAGHTDGVNDLRR